MRIVDKVFVDDDINLDGNEFVRCTFDGCQLRYGGGDMPTVTGCTFINVRFAFDHGAGRTVMLLNALSKVGVLSLSIPTQS